MYRYFFIWILLFCLGPHGDIIWAGEEPVKITSRVDRTSVNLEFKGKEFLFSASLESLLLESAAPGMLQVVFPRTGAAQKGIPGEPALPGISRLFEAGSNTVEKILILHADSLIIELAGTWPGAEVLPFAASVRKGGRMEIPVKDSLKYMQDRWYGAPLLSVAYEGRLRGLEISSLHFNPVQYHPLKKQLKFFYNVEASLHMSAESASDSRGDPVFASLNGMVARQLGKATEKAIQASEAMGLIILSDTLFREELQPLVEWKTRKGFQVEEFYANVQFPLAHRDSIKDWLKEYYHKPPGGRSRPSYLLIVGDVAHIPTSQASGEITDLYYAEYDGEGDYIPDLFYGRISVETPEQLEGVIQKILEYEQYRFPDPTFLDRNVLIAGVDASYAGTYGNGQINYAYEEYLNEERGFQTQVFRYPGSDTASGTIIDLLSEGQGFVNYTGHGEYNMWVNPRFSISDVDGLQNQSMYPLIMGNGCETNHFTYPECFAESLLRARNKGALAYIGCTNDSYWDEDYYWTVGVGRISANPVYGESSPGYFDRVFHSHGEDRALWTPSLGEMIFGGNMAVQESSSTLKKFYWEIYQLAGDPSLVPWFGQAGAVHAVYPQVIPPGTRKLDIACAPYCYMAVSASGILLDARHAGANGTGSLYLPDTLGPGMLDLVISGEKIIPLELEIEIAELDGSFLEILTYELGSESAEADQLISPLEHAGINLQLVNRGKGGFSGDTLRLFCPDPSLVLLDSLLLPGDIGPGDTLFIEDAFSLRGGKALEDQTIVGMEISSEGRSLMFLQQRLTAPVLESWGLWWDDRPEGNGNGIPESGEMLQGSWRLFNSGHYPSGILEGAYQSGPGLVLEEFEAENDLSLQAGEKKVLQFRARLGQAGKGRQGAGLLTATGEIIRADQDLILPVGLRFEDFSLAGREAYPFTSSSDMAWRIDSSKYQSVPYSLRSASIAHLESSEISLFMEVEKPDSLLFSYRVSSEYNYDFLEFMLDSVVLGRWSGEEDWSTMRIALDPGSHSVSWRYRKDQNTNAGFDAAWIDDIILPASAFRKGDVALMELSRPVSGPWLSDQERPVFLLKNLSLDTIRAWEIEIAIDHEQAEILSGGTILPGAEVEVEADTLYDFSLLGSYLMEASLRGDSMAYQGNNYLQKEVLHYAYPDLALSFVEISGKGDSSILARIKAENEGNLVWEVLHYKLSIDNEFRYSDSLTIALQPGSDTILDLPLLEEGRTLEQGEHSFRISLITTDSIASNNTVEGSFHYSPMNLVPETDMVSWALYPNPVKDQLNICLEGPAKRRMSFIIYSVEGRILGRSELEEGTGRIQWSTRGQRAGLYFVRETEEGKVLKFVLAH